MEILGLLQFKVICVIPMGIGNNEISITNLSFTVLFVIVLGILILYGLYGNQVIPRNGQVILKMSYQIVYQQIKKWLLENFLFIFSLLIFILLDYSNYLINFYLFLGILYFFNILNSDKILILKSDYYVDCLKLDNSIVFFKMSEFASCRYKDRAIVTFDFVRCINKKIYDMKNSIFAGDHPTNIRIANVDNSSEKIVVSTNLTTKATNAVLIASEGEISNHKQFMFNEVRLTPLIDEGNNVNVKNVENVIHQLSNSHVLKGLSSNLQKNPDIVFALHKNQKEMIELMLNKSVSFEHISNLEKTLIEIRNKNLSDMRITSQKFDPAKFD